jgi:ethanolamine ammonia-lyase large subunit
MIFRHTIAGQLFTFQSLKELLAKATPLRSGDILAGVAAQSAQERVAAQRTLADVPLKHFLDECLVDTDEVTRLIFDSHNLDAFAPISSLTVGEFREWLLSDATTTEMLTSISSGLIPEMVAAVSKIMRLQDLILVAKKCSVMTKFRNTIGLPGRLSTRLQPNHPTDDPHGVGASMIDGILLGSGDAVIGINPATDSVDNCIQLLELIDNFRTRYDIPIQSSVLAHITTSIQAMQHGAPLDLVFQSIAGTQEANRSFGIDLALIKEAREMALSLNRGSVGNNVMYFETGQGSALSANAHHGIDQQTAETRAYAVARAFDPLLVNTVVGFIGPEYLYDGKQIIRAGLEDHVCGKLLGLPMGCDICYTNHAEADQDDMDTLLTLLGVAGCNFIMGVPGADDIMLNYQSTSFHDALYVREALGKRPAPEFEDWLNKMGIGKSDNSSQKHLNSSKPNGQLLTLIEGLDNQLTKSETSITYPGNPWVKLREFTPARIGLECIGVSQPTESLLDFSWDHARARDAVHSSLDITTIENQLGKIGLKYLAVSGNILNRSEYLQRPDKGRRLSEDSVIKLEQFDKDWDLVFVIADGLSSTSIHDNALDMLKDTLHKLKSDNLRIAPIIIAEQARVALGDGIASLIQAKMVAVLIGERPGLTAYNSLGAYITWNPKVGTVDSERNCISNIRDGGLSYDEASSKLVYLIRSARSLGLTGVGLKEESLQLRENQSPLLGN